jgi:plastocyanin domain-containing protein
MTLDKIFVMILGIAGMGFVAWFFFGKKEDISDIIEDGNDIKIKVSGGYNPSTIVLRKGVQATLSFFRTDPSSCLEEVIIPDFKIRKFLPLKVETRIDLKPEHTGEFSLSCGMNMFHGKIIVRG